MIFYYLNEGYTPEKALDVAFSADPENPVKVNESLSIPRRSKPLTLSYRTEEALLDD